MKAEDKPSTSPFDPADLLENDDIILGYLADALASRDPAFIDDALDVAHRAAKRLGAMTATNLRPSDYETFFAALGASAELSDELKNAVARFRMRAWGYRWRLWISLGSCPGWMVKAIRCDSTR